MLGFGNCEGVAAGVARGVIASFAGLHFELEGEQRTCERVARVARREGMAAIAGEMGTGPSDVSHIVSPKFLRGCLLHLQPRAFAPPAPPAALTWRWTQEGGTLATRFVFAQLEHAAGRVVARAWLDDDARAPHDLLNGLVVMLTHRLGGAVFHAASVEVADRVVAFVGPSGAGKSTACLHMDQAPIFSVDRLALLPVESIPPELVALHADASGTPAAVAPARRAPASRHRWFAHPLPGGTRPFTHTPFARPRWLPLACLLGVQKSAQGARIVTPSRAGAVTLLRESTFQAGLTPEAERELLASLDDLASHVPVGRLHWSLGATLKAVSSRWLMGQAEERT